MMYFAGFTSLPSQQQIIAAMFLGLAGALGLVMCLIYVNKKTKNRHPLARLALVVVAGQVYVLILTLMLILILRMAT